MGRVMLSHVGLLEFSKEIPSILSDWSYGVHVGVEDHVPVCGIAVERISNKLLICYMFCYVLFYYFLSLFVWHYVPFI